MTKNPVYMDIISVKKIREYNVAVGQHDTRSNDKGLEGKDG
jgi:hypothetical protein